MQTNFCKKLRAKYSQEFKKNEGQTFRRRDKNLQHYDCHKCLSFFRCSIIIIIMASSHHRHSLTTTTPTTTKKEVNATGRPRHMPTPPRDDIILYIRKSSSSIDYRFYRIAS